MGYMDWKDEEPRKNYDYGNDGEMTPEKKMKTAMVCLSIVVAVLAGVLAYIWWQKSSLINDLNIEKEELTAQMIELQNDYATLSSDYDTINSQLDSSREEVSQLIERIKKTEATNRSMIRKYEKELGTLRSIMRNYIVQIDSLNTANKKLKADAAAARREAAESRKQSEELSKEVKSLSDQVAVGAVIKARGIKLEAFNASDKVTDRSSRVKRLIASLALVENDLAKEGPVRVYVRVKDPNGILLTNSTQRTFSVNGGEPMICSASREVDYTGKEVEMAIYINDIPLFEKGVYTLEVYTSQTKLGEAEVMLR